MNTYKIKQTKIRNETHNKLQKIFFHDILKIYEYIYIDIYSLTKWKLTREKKPFNKLNQRHKHTDTYTQYKLQNRIKYVKLLHLNFVRNNQNPKLAGQTPIFCAHSEKKNKINCNKFVENDELNVKEKLYIYDFILFCLCFISWFRNQK